MGSGFLFRPEHRFCLAGAMGAGAAPDAALAAVGRWGGAGHTGQTGELLAKSLKWIMIRAGQIKASCRLALEQVTR